MAGDPTRFQHVSLLATDMHWLDVGPPRFRAPGLAGLRARGVEGVAASVDAILSAMFLDMNAIADPATVRGYIDGSPLGTMPDAVFTPMGVGDGSLWPVGGWRYRITSSMWSAHDLGFGRLTRPVAVTALAPRGSVGTRTPTFRWRRLPSAASYQLRVYRGDRLVLAARALTVTAWRSAKALPRAVGLTWTVRGVNAAGAGPWSPRLRMRSADGVVGARPRGRAAGVTVALPPLSNGGGVRPSGRTTPSAATSSLSTPRWCFRQPSSSRAREATESR